MKPTAKAKAVKTSTGKTAAPKAIEKEIASRGVQVVDSVLTLSSDISKSVVAKRAYELWQGGHCEQGNELKHWLEAEKQLKEQSLELSQSGFE
jgi:hypothetical protein